jgi:membrane protein YdbS with pleckstrin-like domain
MYDFAKETVLRLFRAPSGPPETPSGAHDHVTVMRAAPRYLSYRMLGVYFFGAVLLALVVGSAVGGFFAPPLWGATALVVVLLGPLFALSYFGVRVDYDLRYYVITERSVRVRQGAWKVQEKTITFANVQNVRVEQGPLQRLFGFSSVRIDTAGGGMVQAGNHAVAMPHGVELAGIENAAEVRDAILAQVRRRSDSGLGDLDDRVVGAAVGAGAGWSEARLQALRDAAAAARALRSAAQLGAGPAAPG